MRATACLLVILSFSAIASADVIYSQPQDPAGGFFHSCWWDPDGSDYDEYAWDGFRLTTARAITEIQWRGAFDPAYFGYGGPAVGFTVAIWSSIAGDSQPDIGSYYQPNPLVRYHVVGNAGQTASGNVGGVTYYDYHYALPVAFQAAANTKYWVEIVAWQHGIPDWCLARATNGDGHYFRYLVGGPYYQTVSGDAAFSLLGSGAQTFNIGASASPSNGGSVSGTGAYPSGSTASLSAVANTGFGFQNWTENGLQVSTSATYAFTVSGNRTLLANFVPAFTIGVQAQPALGGTVSGGGIYNTGTTVTVNAAANSGFFFTDWLDGGVSVSTSPTYSFAADANHFLVANFATSAILFDFDNAPVHTSLPLYLTVGGLTAHFTATGQGFSIQQANTMGFTPAGFGGLCIYPNSVFAADLAVDFSAVATDFSIMYAPQELACDTSAQMRVTAFLAGAQVGTNTTTAPQPGTWPTGTLAISVPSGFDRVVVHYDARPPTCQDWGPIFLADNMLVTPTCAAPTMTWQPTSDVACSIGGSSFYAAASGTTPINHLWQAELDPGVWSDMADGYLIHNGVVLGLVSGSAADWMQISSLIYFNQDRPSLNIRCLVSNACGSTLSNTCTLTVFTTGTGDVNGDGVINGLDIQAYIDLVMQGGSPSAGWCAADLDMDGWMDDTEVPLLVNLLLSQ